MCSQKGTIVLIIDLLRLSMVPLMDSESCGTNQGLTSPLPIGSLTPPNHAKTSRPYLPYPLPLWTLSLTLRAFSQSTCAKLFHIPIFNSEFLIEKSDSKNCCKMLHLPWPKVTMKETNNYYSHTTKTHSKYELKFLVNVWDRPWTSYERVWIL